MGDRARSGRTFAALALLFLLVVEDVLEAFVDDDLALVLFYTAEAGVGLEAGETGVRHGGREQRRAASQSAQGRGKFWRMTIEDARKGRS